MDNNFEDLFNEKVAKKIKNSFEDIEFSNIIKTKIKEEALRKKSLKERINDFFNYELEIDIYKIVVAAILIITIPTSYTLYEGKKIIDNNIELVEMVVNDKR